MKHPGWWNLNLLFFRHVSAYTCNAAHMFPGLEPIHLRLLRHMLQVAPQDQSLEGQLLLAKHQPVIDGPKSEHVRHPLPRYHLYNIYIYIKVSADSRVPSRLFSSVTLAILSRFWWALDRGRCGFFRSCLLAHLFGQVRFLPLQRSGHCHLP